MNLQRSKIKARTVLLTLLVIAFACAAAVAQTHTQMLLASTPAAKDLGKGFTTPQLAADALIKAAETYDVPALLEIFGPEGKDLVASADPVRDKSRVQEFVEKAHEKNTVQVANLKATLLIGNDEWPLPIPLLKKQGKWYFDTTTGRKEILFRRIGSNELDAIRICRGFVEAQKQYASTIHDNSGVHQYA